MTKLTSKKDKKFEMIAPMEEICKFLGLDEKEFRNESPMFYNDMLEEKGLGYEITTTPWYAVILDKEDYPDWGSGSYNLEEAKEEAKEADAYCIAVIDEGYFSNDDSLCTDEIYDFD